PLFDHHIVVVVTKYPSSDICLFGSLDEIIAVRHEGGSHRINGELGIVARGMRKMMSNDHSRPLVRLLQLVEQPTARFLMLLERILGHPACPAVCQDATVIVQIVESGCLALPLVSRQG